MKLRATLDGCCLSLSVDKTISASKQYNNCEDTRFVAINIGEVISIFSETELLQITGEETYDNALAKFKDYLYTELVVH